MGWGRFGASSCRYAWPAARPADDSAAADDGDTHGGYSTLEFTTRDRPGSWIRPAFTRKWFPDAFLATMGELFLAIEQDREATISVRDNLQTMRLVEAGYRSAAERRTVRLDEITLGDDRAVRHMQMGRFGGSGTDERA